MSGELRVPHRGIGIGLVVGAVAGGLANAAGVEPGPPPQPAPWLEGVIRYLTEPLGRIFLNLLLMTVVPLVFCSLVVGVGRLGNVGQLGRLGLHTLGYFLITSTAAVVIGITLVNLVRPGDILPPETVEQMRPLYGATARERGRPADFGIHTFVNMVPRNPLQAAVELNMLGIIIFALLFGVGMHRVPLARRGMLTDVLEGIGEAMVAIIGLALRLAPIGVCALMFTATAQFGFRLLAALGMYVAVVLTGLAIQMGVVFPLLVRGLGRRSPSAFFRQVRGVILTAFSTSSSNATLPASLQVAERELGVSRPVAGFVLPLGATMNMNGTALFEGVTVLFLAQVSGVELTVGQQLLVVALSVVTAVGAAGVPGGSIPLLAMVLSTVGIPPEMLFLILGIDRLLDMCRTTVNVVGDLTAAVYVDRLHPPVAVEGAEPMQSGVASAGQWQEAVRHPPDSTRSY